MINYANDYRTIFEPFHPTHSRRARKHHPQWAKFVEPDYSDVPLEETCVQLWQGRVRDPWIDKHNTKRIAVRRMIKSVESTNLLPWIVARWPHLKVVYLLRHPFATSESQLDLQFQDHGLTDLTALRNRPRLIDDACAGLTRSERAGELIDHAEDPFEQHVLRWCLENRIPLTTLDPEHTHVVLHEHLVLNPTLERTRLGEYSGTNFDDRALEVANKPSRTDFRPEPLPLVDAARVLRGTLQTCPSADEESRPRLIS